MPEENTTAAKPNVALIILAVLVALAVFGFAIYAMVHFLKRPRPVAQTVETLLSVCANDDVDTQQPVP